MEQLWESLREWAKVRWWAVRGGSLRCWVERWLPVRGWSVWMWLPAEQPEE